ncbi:MAG TPA: YceI family protein, partial [Xanthomonadaceae bacterium]|nr:YceI family protein [Xanthomonadaceae bacterium]
LRGKAFLDAARHPTARYAARGFRAMGPGRYTAFGNLSLRGVTRPVTFNFRWTPGVKPLLVGTAVVKRLQFGVGAGEWADVGVLGNDIAVHARVVLTPVAASAKKRP